MRNLIVTLLAAWALAGCTPAPTPASAPTSPQAGAEPAIWRITDTDSEIWLYGTVHVLPRELEWQGPRLRTAFAAADELITETETGPAAAQAFPQLALRFGALPAGQTLSERLPQRERTQLARLAPTVGIQTAQLENLRPWLAALYLSNAYITRRGHTADVGVEAVLAAEAQRANKRITYLETPEQQIRALASLSRDDEARFLSITLDEIETGDDARLDAMDAAWARGDTTTLNNLLTEDWREAGRGVHEAVILNRNRAWADEIARRLAGSGRIFIAVGAAHLLGDGSVVALLRRRGIEVEGP